MNTGQCTPCVEWEGCLQHAPRSASAIAAAISRVRDEWERKPQQLRMRANMPRLHKMPPHAPPPVAVRERSNSCSTRHMVRAACTSCAGVPPGPVLPLLCNIVVERRGGSLTHGCGCCRGGGGHRTVVVAGCRNGTGGFQKVCRSRRRHCQAVPSTCRRRAYACWCGDASAASVAHDQTSGNAKTTTCFVP